MYRAMSRMAEREGYPEVAEAYIRIAWEEAEHAVRFAELIGEEVEEGTEANLLARVAAEKGACKGKKLVPRPENLVMTPSMTLSMRCARMKLATVWPLPVYSSGISADKV